MSNDLFLHRLLVLLASEQCNLHSQDSDYLAAYPSWTDRIYALENIIWRYKLRTGTDK